MVTQPSAKQMPLCVSRCCCGFGDGVSLCPLRLQRASTLSLGRGKYIPDFWSLVEILAVLSNLEGCQVFCAPPPEFWSSDLCQPPFCSYNRKYLRNSF